MNKLASLAFLVAGMSVALAAPIDDLASPNQATRDAAAKILRVTWRPSPAAKWAPLLAMIKPGLSAKALEGIMKRKPDGEGPNLIFFEYRLDDSWVANVGYDHWRDAVTGVELNTDPRAFWVAPPKDYTGRWTTYYANGQKANEIGYRNGIYFGEFIRYHENGVPLYIQHFDASGCNGTDTGYFPSGQVEYRAYHAHNEEVGIWIWYNEDGSVRSTQDHTK